MKINKTASVNGIPLPRTGPAAIEQFLIEKVQADLGSFKDLARITPVLRADTEDGDLSGNVSNGYGNIMITIGSINVHIPFIIHEKMLLPFDVIRLGNQEVSYDASKLRKVVNGIDQKLKEADAQGADGSYAMGEIVDRKNVNSGNGFLGTIMQTRDNEIARHGNGMVPFSGPDFGTLDDLRIDRYASADADVMEVFGEVMQKIAELTIVPETAVHEYLIGLEKKASEETEAFRDQMINVKLDTLESRKVKREMALLDKEKLADVKRAASGNNIVFPMTQDGHFEHRNGRVYHTIESLSGRPQTSSGNRISSVIIDAKGGYRLLSPSDPFMMTVKEARAFEMPCELVRGLQKERMYVMEMGPQKISVPFIVEKRYNHDTAHGYHRKFLYHNLQDAVNSPVNSLFTDAINCQEVTYSKNGDYECQETFKILIDRNENNKNIMMLDEAGVGQYITKHAMNPEDAQKARHMVGYAQRYIVCGPNVECFPMKKLIIGHFTKADGYFSEGPITKEAAYQSNNQVKLLVTKDRMPRTYAIEFRFADQQQTGDAASVQLKQHRMDGLSEQQAKKTLLDLGYNHRQIEMFFEITKRNGRQAGMDMPSPEKAKQLLPADRGKEKTQEFASKLANATLNANNFMPAIEDVATSGFSELLTQSLGGSPIHSALHSFLKASETTATNMEKVAHQMKGPAWHELSALLNMKYRLDKVAHAVANRHVVLHADGLFEKVASILPKIAMYQSNLIDMNRKQMLTYDRPLVDPSLIKTAIHQLDGLSRYARVAAEREVEKLGKSQALANPGAELSKLASFFRGYRNLNPQQMARVQAINPMINQLKRELDTASKRLKERYNELAGLKRMVSPNEKRKARVESEIEDLKRQTERLSEQLRQLGVERAEIEQTKTNANALLTIGAGVPVISALTYGYQTIKEK